MSALRHVLIASEPGKDGVFAVVRGLVRHLHRAHPGVVVDLAWSSRRQRGGADALAEEVRAHGGEALDLRVSNAPEIGDIAAIVKLSALIHRRRPQLIHAHSSKAGALSRLRAILPGCPPVIYTPNAYYGMARRGGWREEFYNTLESIFGRIGLTACCSADERDFAIETLRLNPAKLLVIDNGIDTRAFTPADVAEKHALREALGIPVDGRLLVTIGRDAEQKNYAPLYAALGRLFTTRADFRFAHAGEGSLRRIASLDAAAQSRCHGYDYLDAPQSLMRAADGFILTSLYEGLSLSMLEALSCGTPVILADVPGLRVIRALGFRWAQWMPAPVDEISTARAITAWLESEPGPIAAQRTLACEHFDQARQFEKLVALYRSLV